MAIRWDHKPAFPNAPEDSERALWTRRSVIAAATALVGTCALTWEMDLWPTLAIFALVALAFDAGDHRVLYGDEHTDDEPMEGDGYDLYSDQR
jgi:nanoRNase/pAp phosphatase (c-di-AMP/oligoRNAs hydrolase)